MLQKFLSSEREIQESTLPRKVLTILFNGFRTANQHRWAGRVAQGERVIPREGTRQNSVRKFAIRTAPQYCGATAKDSWRLFIKNTAPC